MQNDSQENYNREDNWKKYPYLFNEQKDLAFECECGKRYMSFPGLYLHFQRKHGLKISTKPEEDECEMYRDPCGATVYKYLIIDKEENKPETTPVESNTKNDALAGTFARYLEDMGKIPLKQGQSSSSQPDLPIYQQHISRFDRFLRTHIFQNSEQIDEGAVANLPNHYNDFILELREKDEILQHQEQQICIFLFDLWKWMNSTSLTTLIVQYEGNHGHGAERIPNFI